MAEASLKYNDVNVGDAAPVLSHELTRTDLVMYAGASGDFNPMHHDEVRFTKQTWPGETLTSAVVVTGKREEDGEQLVDLEVVLANQDGEVKVAGEAVAVAA